MRQTFRLIRPGVCTDGTKFEGRCVEFFYDADKLPPERALLRPGELFSAEILVGTQDQLDPDSIFLEERGNFESAATTWGLGTDDADVGQARGWQPRNNPDTGLNGGTPHNGRFSDDRFSPILVKEK